MKDAPRSRPGKGSSRKVGRDLMKCQRYRERGIRLRNKIRRLRKHIKANPNEENGAKALKELEARLIT